MKWFKFYGQDFLADMKMSQLSIAERLMWVTILCLAHEEDKDGNVRYCTEELLKSKMGLQETDPEWEDLKGVFNLFVSLEMIEKTDRGIFVKNFQKRQEINLTPAEKMQRYRTKKKGNISYQETVTDVTPNRIEENRIDNTRVAIAPRIPIKEESEIQPKEKQPNVTKEYDEMVIWLEGVTGVRIINRAKQYKQLAKARLAEISKTRLKNRAQELLSKAWYQENGLDWGGVVNSFDKKS